MIVEETTFRSAGVDLAASLVLPEGVAEAGVVCITGGSANRHETYREWQEYMAAQGLASIAFDARGVHGSNGSFRTDSEGYNAQTSPANSQASRTEDTAGAYAFLQTRLGLEDQSMAIIGNSMGGDIALRALDIVHPGALILNTPAAYPPEAHELEYGPDWGPRIREIGGPPAALASPNFVTVEEMDIPALLIYAGNEQVIPGIIQQRYKDSINDAGGEMRIVGDETTGHAFITARLNPKTDSVMNEQARSDLYNYSTQFLLSCLTRVWV